MTLTVFLLVFHISGAACAVNAVMNARTDQGALAWAISLLTIPFVAVPAYLFFGRSKFEGFVEAYEERAKEIDSLRAQYRAELEPWTVSVEDRGQVYRAIRELTGHSMTKGNRATLLVNGDATFDDIIAGIVAAERYVLVQFYMIHDDGLGRRLRDALIERASAGLRVQVLYDEIGSKGLPKRYLSELRSAGVEVTSFKPTQGRRNRFQLNFRNHRKMVVVDGKVGWVGGHNVGDEYLGLDPDFTPWRDTHVRLEGPCVIQLQSVILSDWFWATRELPELTLKPTPAEASDSHAMIIPFAPSQRHETAGLFFVSALQSARKRIWISAPYFVPDEAVMKALELAALRGVDVRIITTGKGDSQAVFLAAFHYMEKLRGLGIRFYAYAPGFLHEKVMLVDDEFSSVGTANFDNRSFRLNFEVTSLIADREFASQMETMFERDFEHSEELNPEEFDQKSFLWRLGVSVARLGAPLL